MPLHCVASRSTGCSVCFSVFCFVHYFFAFFVLSYVWIINSNKCASVVNYNVGFVMASGSSSKMRVICPFLFVNKN